MILRDQEGRSDEDVKLENALTTNGGMIEGYGRSLLDVFKVKTIAEAMAEIRRRCNNNGEIDKSKIPDFRGIRIGDYLDLPSLDDGTTKFIWNDDYKNLRILVSGFNHYKGHGDTENADNHILFTFRHCVTTKRMNPTDTNAGGYNDTELKKYLEEVFALGLKQVIGDYLYSVRRLLSIGTGGSWAWYTNTVFLPTEREVWRSSVRAHPEWDGGTTGQYHIFVHTAYKVKRFNGSRNWWCSSPHGSVASYFCAVSSHIHAHYNAASSVGGVSPDSVKVNNV